MINNGKILIVVLSLFLLTCNCSNKSSFVHDDRLVDLPLQDSILEVMTSDYKAVVSKYYQGVSDTSSFFVTLELHTRNDTNLVWVMGDYTMPLLFHDSVTHSQNFIGFFNRNSDFCFVYSNLFSDESANPSATIISNLLNGWNLRSPSSNPDFFSHGLSDSCDPWIIEYSIDSAGNIMRLRTGRW